MFTLRPKTKEFKLIIDDEVVALVHATCVAEAWELVADSDVINDCFDLETQKVMLEAPDGERYS